jgi:carnitine O-acetyltransferase
MAPARRSLHSSSAKKSANVTYQHQDVLPCLPIPSISSTATKFLDSARPFVSDPAPGAPVASDANPTEEYTRLKAVVKDFESSEFVQELQKRLEEHAKGKDNWLIEWFNEANYFGESSYTREAEA